MTKNNKKTKTIPFKDGSEATMLRVDKTVKEMMKEKPSSRWDVEYWHLKYDQMFETLSKHFEINSFDSFMLKGTAGITYGQVGKRIYDPNGEIQYLQVSNIRNTGVDIYGRFAKVRKDSHNDPDRSRLNNEDLLLVNGGVGSLGRSCVFLGPNEKFNISQDIDRIRFVGELNPYYASIFLNSKFGQAQMERFMKGVSGQTKIGFDHVRSIQVPLLPETVQFHVKQEYLKMSKFYDKAMEAKKRGDEQAYKENLETAEKMLKDLITKTEAVIRGERKDVI